ncbi:electron transfer flavoprotein alpha subunit [Arthrobacter sp. B3I9]|nr:electron transfer flavoprotein alpha subunit [Arthrobacter sp. B3I9]
MAKVLVFIDNPGETLKKSSLELLTIARSLGEPAVAFNGELHDGVASTLGAYGVQALYRPSAADLDDYLVGPKASYLAAAVQTAGAGIVLAENTADGREVAARLGIKLGAGVITDVVGVDPDGTAHKSVLAGSYMTTAKATTPGGRAHGKGQHHHAGAGRHRHGAAVHHRRGAGDGHRRIGQDHCTQ